MNNKNYLDKIEYVFANIFWAGVAMVFYNNLVLRCLPGCTLKFSETVMWVMLVVFTVFGMAVTFVSRRNTLSVFVNVLTPFEIYSIISFGRDMTVLAVISVSTTLIFSIAYFVTVLSQKIRNRKYKKQIMKLRIKFGFSGSRVIAAFCMLVFLVPLCANILFGKNMAFNNTKSEVPVSDGKYTIENNIEVLTRLNSENWEQLDLNDRVDVLQTIANIEADYLGLTNELNVKLVKTDENVVATYTDKNHTINVNILCLDRMSSCEMLNTVLHEAYHGYQYRLCDAYHSVGDEYKTLRAFANVPSYEKEFRNYTYGSDNWYTYYRQECESRARYYAEEREYDYFEAIRFYTGQQING